MKLKLKIGSTILLINAEQASQGLTIAEHAEVWNEDWNSKLSKAENQKIEVTFLKDEDLLPTPEPIVALNKSLEESNTRWYKEYSDHNKTKEEKKELERKLAAMQEAVKEI